jgi:hypothetical protein
MPQGDKSSHTDKQQRQVEPIKTGQDENGGGKSAEAQIWAAANKLILDDKEPFSENQELI